MAGSGGNIASVKNFLMKNGIKNVKNEKYYSKDIYDQSKDNMKNFDFKNNSKCQIKITSLKTLSHIFT